MRLLILSPGSRWAVLALRLLPGGGGRRPRAPRRIGRAATLVRRGRAAAFIRRCGGAAASSDPAAPDPPRDPDAPLIEGNRYSYCDPAAAIAAHPRFSAVPEFVARAQGGPGGGTTWSSTYTRPRQHAPRRPSCSARLRHAVVDASGDPVAALRPRRVGTSEHGLPVRDIPGAERRAVLSR